MKTSQFAWRAGTPEYPAIIDMRIDESFGSDPRMIPGVRRRRFDDMASLCDLFFRRARGATHDGQVCPAAVTKA